MDLQTMVDCQNLLTMLESYRANASATDKTAAQKSTIRAIAAMIACDPEAQKAELEKLL